MVEPFEGSSVAGPMSAAFFGWKDASTRPARGTMDPPSTRLSGQSPSDNMIHLQAKAPVLEVPLVKVAVPEMYTRAPLKTVAVELDDMLVDNKGA